MIFSEYVRLLTEGFKDEKELILDDAQLIQDVKNKFINANCTCHAVDGSRYSYKTDDQFNVYLGSNEAGHNTAIELILPKEAEHFNNLVQSAKTNKKYTDKFIADFIKFGRIQYIDTEHRNSLAQHLFPYSTSNEYKTKEMRNRIIKDIVCKPIVCLYNDLKHPKMKVVIDIKNDTIVTVYNPGTATYWEDRYTEPEFRNPKFFNILFLAKYDAPYIETYKVLQNLLKTQKLLPASFEKIVYTFCEKYWNINISPQTKQQVFRKLDDELRQFVDNTALQQIEKM